MILVLARNLQKFQEWCKVNGYDYARARSSLVYVDRIEKVYGLNNISEVILYGNWWESDMVKQGDAHDILSAITQRVHLAPKPEMPPLGIMAEWLWKERRVHELIRAINRYDVVFDYHDADTTIAKWCSELYELSLWLQEHKAKEKK